jgi:glutathione transport system permease protein
MPTLWLTVVAMVWATILGVVIGVISGVRRGQWQDQTGMVLAVSGISFPAFWLGLLLIDLFSVRLHWLPTGGDETWRSYILPGFTLGVAVAAVMARFTRSAFVEVASEDYVRTARMKGLPERRVVWTHTLRNALIPVITMTGLQFGFLLGGSIVIETVFAWPGLGRLLVDSVNYRDYPVIQAEILLFSFEFVLINLGVDVLYAIVNPEIRLR